MKTTIIAAGKLKEPYWREACEEYAKRLSATTTLSIVEVADRDPQRSTVERALQAEGADILKALPAAQSWVIALTIEGTRYSS